jgi:hypothetical protein
VFDFRLQDTVPQMGMPASSNFGGGAAASAVAPELAPEDAPLLEAPLLLVPPPVLLAPLLLVPLPLLPLLPPLELVAPDDAPLPLELAPLYPPLLLLPLLQPVDAVPEKAARPRRDEARQATMVGWRMRAPWGRVSLVPYFSPKAAPTEGSEVLAPAPFRAHDCTSATRNLLAHFNMTRNSIAFGAFLMGTAATFWLGACGSPSSGGFAGDNGGSSSSGSGSGATSTSSSGRSSSAGSGSGSDAGTSSGNGTSSGVTSSGADANLDALADVAPPPDYDGGPQPCGTQVGAQTCSLKTSTCCVNQALNGQCVPHGTACPAPQMVGTLTFPYAGFSCLGKIDCASGQICCGVANTTQANTACQAVAPGACVPTTANSTMGSAQLCVTSAECAAGVQCIAQKCVGSTNFKLCGLHDQPPFSCKAQ